MSMMNAREADRVRRVKAHLDRLGYEPLTLRMAASLVHELENRKGKRQREAANDLLGCVAAHLHRGWEIPAPAVTWLCDALIRISSLDEEPSIAFALKAGRGRPKKESATLERVAYMHALICWGMKKEPAADIVSRFVKLAEVSELVKAYNRTTKVWKLEEPALTDRQPDELEWRATAKQFLDGRMVAVTVRSPHKNPETSFWLSESFRDHVEKVGVF